MKGSIAWFARNSVAANLLMLGIFAIGAVSLLNSKMEIFPETELDIVNIRVPYPGAAPAEVEDGVCIRIEEAIQDLEGIKEIRSQANENIGIVNVEVQTGFKTRELLDNIKVRVDAIDTFPKEAERPVIEELLIKSQVLSIAVSGKADEKTLRHLAEKVREDILTFGESYRARQPMLPMRIWQALSPASEAEAKKGLLTRLGRALILPGDVSFAEMANVRPYEIGIEVSETQLRRYGLTFDDVANAVRKSSLDLPGGTLKTSAGEILLRTKGQAYYGKDFSDLVLITRNDGSRIRLGDVAKINDGFEETPLSSSFDGENAALVNVFRVGDESALQVAAAAHRYVEETNPTMPAGIKLEIWKDDSNFLKDRITLLVKNAFQGLCLVFLALALFLRLNVAGWVTLGIPTSFFGAFFVMSLLGVSINMISLFGMILVLGIIVDDAIVVAENVYTLSQRQGHSSLLVTIKGTLEVTVPVIFAVLTSIAAFTPMLGVPGVSGKIWRVIPLTVIPTLFFSLIESKWILPAHLAHLKIDHSAQKSKIGKFQDFFSKGLEKFIRVFYRRIVFFTTQHRYSTLAAFIALCTISIGMVASGWVQFVFFPRVPADFVIARLEMPEGIPSEVTAAAVHKIEQAALKLRDEIDAKTGIGHSNFSHILATVGTQPFKGAFELKDTSARSHLGEVTVELAPVGVRSITSAAVEKRWRELTGEIPGAIDLNFTSKLQSVGSPFDIRLTGTDYQALQNAAEDLKKAMATYPGVLDITDSFRNGKKEIRLDIKPSAEALGLTLSDLARQTRQAFYGEEAQKIQRGRDEIKVLVRYPRNERRSVKNLEDMRIRTPEGEEVPFDSVADYHLDRGFSTIKRVNRQRAINITADVDDTVTNAQKVLDDLTKKRLPILRKLYPSVNISYEGQSQEQRDTINSLAINGLLALFAIYALMAIPFRSYNKPLIIMSVIPFSLVGAIWGHILMFMPLSMMSVCGMIALSGVVVNDGLVLIDWINQSRWRGLPLGLSVRRAGVARFRAILLTSLTTFVGLIPLLSETSTQAQFLKPMAISLAFGIAFATVINLILVPAIYLIFEDIKRLFHIGRSPGFRESEEARDAA